MSSRAPGFGVLAATPGTLGLLVVRAQGLVLAKCEFQPQLRLC